MRDPGVSALRCIETQTILLPDRFSGEESEERRVELLRPVEHGHVSGVLQDEEGRDRKLLPQQVSTEGGIR